MWWPGGRLTGTVNYKGHIYSIKNMGGSMHGVVEMDPDGLPAEHAPMSPEQMQKMNMRDDPLVKQGDASMMMDNAARSDREHRPGARRHAQSRGCAADHGRSRAVPFRPRSQRSTNARRKQKPVTITLLVAYTKQAASHYSNIART